MFWIVISIVLALGAFILLGLREEEGRYSSHIVFGLRKRQFLSLAFLLFAFIGCFKSVPTGHTGIVTNFGKVEDYTLEAGIHFERPWVKVIDMDNRTQKNTLTLSCFSSDIQEVTVVYTVNYQINKANASAIYRNIGTAYFSTIVEPRVYEAIKGAFAKYNAEVLLSNREGLSKEIQAVLLADMATYNIEIVSTSIEDIDFTDSFTAAVEAKQVAEQNKLKAQTEQEQKVLEAEAQAQRDVIEAQAKADSAMIAAENDAAIAKIAADSAEYQGKKDAAIMDAIGTKLSEYPELVQYYYVMNWSGELPQTMLGSGATPVYPIQ